MTDKIRSSPVHQAAGIHLKWAVSLNFEEMMGVN
jgi:hypothetical protein